MSDMDQSFKWYRVIKDFSLEQGDILKSFPVLVQIDDPSEESGIGVDALTYNVIVMTQSCDFQKADGKPDEEAIINVCPIFDYKEYIKENPKLGGPDAWGKLRKGHLIQYHLLHRSDIEEVDFEYQIVDLSKIYSAPLSFVQKVARSQGEYVRLMPPYREHLAQSFARRFMRVGLPLDLPNKYPYASTPPKP